MHNNVSYDCRKRGFCVSLDNSRVTIELIAPDILDYPRRKLPFLRQPPRGFAPRKNKCPKEAQLWFWENKSQLKFSQKVKIQLKTLENNVALLFLIFFPLQYSDKKIKNNR